MLQEEIAKQMSEPMMWKKENLVSTPATPSMASYTDAMNKFTQAATAFMDHVHLLTEARDAYQMAITASASFTRWRLPLAHPCVVVSTQATEPCDL